MCFLFWFTTLIEKKKANREHQRTSILVERTFFIRPVLLSLCNFPNKSTRKSIATQFSRSHASNGSTFCTYKISIGFARRQPSHRNRHVERELESDMCSFADEFRADDSSWRSNVTICNERAVLGREQFISFCIDFILSRGDLQERRKTSSRYLLN